MLSLLLTSALLCQLDAAPDAGVVPHPAPDDAGVRAVADAGIAGPPPLPKGFTGLRGRVVDARTGEPLIEATVKLLSGPKKSALTDVDGHYRLKLPAGTYELRVFYELYQGRRIGNVEVKAGQATTLDVELLPDSRSVQEVVVEAKADKRNETALLQERKKAAVVSDSIGAQELAKTPDSSAGDAVKRVVGVTLVEGKYPVVRGLSGRYVTTLLNGAALPSPEPDEPAVPLDLFPTALISDLNLQKTYSADMPAAFGGGALTVGTNTFPTQLEVKLKAQFGVDNVSSFVVRPAADLAFAEGLGLRDPSRALPAAISRDVSVLAKNQTAEERERAGEAFVDQWTPSQVKGLPEGSFGAQVGDTVKLGKDARLGFLVAGQWSRKDRTRFFTVGDVKLREGGEPVLQDQGTVVDSSVGGATSVLANVGLQLNRDHEVSLLGLYLLNAEGRAVQTQAYENQQTTNFTASRLQFVQRQLYFHQLRGFHRLGFLNDAELDWQASYGRVLRVEPDIRDTRSDLGPDGVARVRFQPNSGERFFFDLTEDSGGAAVNLTVPVRAFRFKGGGFAQGQVRHFDGRRFRFVGRFTEALSGLSPEQVFTPTHIGPPFTGDQVLALEETTAQFDRYDASLFVGGGYAQAEWKPKDWLRLLGGLRYEGAGQAVTSGTPFATQGAPIQPIAKAYADFVPTLNVTVAPVSQVNLRGAYAYTLARPTFREIGPFLFFDPVRRRNVSGNPNLERTRIHHADLRAEWFPTDGDVVAVSGFFKQFEQPIEKVIIGAQSSNDFGFRNATGATVAGLELEARVGLGTWLKPLTGLRVGGNLALIASQVQLPPDVGLVTNAKRPLQGQSPYVGNAFVTWEQAGWGTELGAFYNVYGPRISEVGINGIPDIYEQPFHRLDLSASQSIGKSGFKLKAALENVLDQSIRLTQGGLTVQQYRPGLRFTFNLSWSLEKNK